MNALQQLEQFGQSVWLDYLKRSLIESGDLHNLIESDGLKGITSNPSIFEKAIGESDEYYGAIKTFQEQADHSISEIYEHLAITDIRSAADVLHSIYLQKRGADGFISLECSPYVAKNTAATVDEALRLWAAVDRPNLMVKVPATAAGIPAIRVLIGKGVNINVTLLFSVDVYEQVVDAYMSGLEDLKQGGGDVSKVASVASFFVSRIDTAVDKRLEQISDREVAKRLRGRAAIANAKIAYSRYEALFSSPRWRLLASLGAKRQRLLWASTGTKDPSYPDTRYVDELIGSDTVNTMPPATMEAFRDHGKATANTITRNVGDAWTTLATLEEQGVSLKEITQELVEDGVQKFSDAFDKLLGAIAQKRSDLHEGGDDPLEIKTTSLEITAAIESELEAWRKEGRIRRLWAGDKSLWTGTNENKWIGWLRIVEKELAELDVVQAFVNQIRHRGIEDVLLLGMGGSSLGPEVLSEIFGRQSHWPRFHMLDSTDPAQIETTEQAINLPKAMFIVSSKSGSTLEPNILLDYFFDRVASQRGDDKAGEQFVAITDPGSSLEHRAKELNFANVFFGAPSIGGRYSVLSKFGLAPAAAMGLDVKRLLETTRPMQRACGPDVPPKENPGVKLGVAIGIAATRFSRDKITIIASEPIAPFGAWLEQLLAESTGKQGRGLIPVVGEPVATPDRYSDDRFFVFLELDGRIDPAMRQAMKALEHAGHPVAHISIKDVWRLGREFFRWEIATAVASAIIGVNPYDQPDVEASKSRTRTLTEQFEASQSLPRDEPIYRENGVALYADPRNAEELGRSNTLSGYLRNHIARARGGTDYLALLAYVERNDKHSRMLAAIRERLRDKTRAATCLGFGPRFQHSTGQAYKGGPNSGVFLQLTCDDPKNITVPGHHYSFGVVKAAQARSDLEVLVERGRRALRIHLEDVETGLPTLARAVESALQ